ncbi:MAG: hypothetical protein WBA05_07260 [Gordonia sp. (in: high G+C Gram-positive bacteria)]|uniref:hypothetical protein n=1 Tax=Gordonia sp. (in: high G+C Gram-positive bacteria) TaxID=84139 RepID=UPI003C74F742
MAAGRPRNPSSSPKRTPKVAGRNAPRVAVSKPAENVDETAPVESDAAPTPSDAAGSGVERKRLAAQEAKDRRRRVKKIREAGPAVRDTSATLSLARKTGAAAVVIGAVAAVLAFHPGAGVTGNQAFVDKPATDRLLSEAANAVCAPFRFDYKTIDNWFATISDSLTGSALTEFRKTEKTNRDITTQAKAAQDCQMEALGVSNLSGDDAVVVTQLLVSTTQNGMIAASDAPHVEFVMRFEDDRWKVAEVHDF